MTAGQEICRTLCDRIGKGVIQNKLPSQRELMAEFHVSSGTVKLALARLEQEKVIYGIRGKGTFVVSTLRRSKSTQKTTVFVRLAVDLLRHPFYITFLTVLDKLLAAQNLSMEFKVQPLRDLRDKLVLFLESRISEGEQIQLERDHSPLKVVSVNFHLPGSFSVLCGNEQGGYAVMEELYRRGHRKIGVIARDLSVKGCFFEERLNGVNRFIREHSDLETVIVNVEPGASTMEEAISQFRMQLPDMTAVFAFTDTFALDILYRTPRPEAVIGYGNSSFCMFQQPALASVDEQPELLAEKTAEILLRFHKGERPEGSISVPSVLIPRASLELNRKDR